MLLQNSLMTLPKLLNILVLIRDLSFVKTCPNTSLHHFTSLHFLLWYIWFPDAVSDGLEIPLPEGGNLVQNYVTSSTYSVLVRMNADDLEDWKKAYTTDNLYSKVLKASQIDNDEAGHYTQYQIRDGLVYFED